MESLDPKYYTVTQYNKAIKKFLDDKSELQDVHIIGEISNFKGHTRGHLYFTLKDEESRMNAVMFQGYANYLNFEPKDGDEVLIDGKISCYVQTGSYQIYVESMVLSGNGDLLKKLEELKEKLSKEGLFDDSHKKPIPKYPKRIGIVTASTGAAIRDILTTIKRRYPLCETILFPSLVQGDLAKDDIVKQIKKAEEYDLDTLIVGRGGGSIEDLWAFNEEIVVRAIYDCPIPVISAVGHEIDFTLADFASDMRAATPTAAAELAVPNIIELASEIKQKQIRMNKSIKNKLEINEQKLDTLINDSTTSIKHKMQNAINMFNNIKKNHILNNPKDIFIKHTNNLELLINKIELLNPLSVIKKGYTVTSKDNKIVNTIKDVKENDTLNIRLIDGELNTKVSEVKTYE
ncbi:MAG: exodeoxyribonuclease VII large subunit [Clostridia bacterium]|nr:exodeoxyribonuclease VII large subunit [Clostridia bacterium]